MADEQSATAETTTEKPRRRRKWLIFAGLLAALIWFAPAIIAGTSLKQRILPAVLPQYPAGMHVGSASLSWTSPAVLRNVTFEDLQQNKFLQVDDITTGETLLQLLLNSDGVHPIKLSGAVIDARFRTDGSNLEDVAAPFADPTSTIWPGVALDISSGTLKLSSDQDGSSATFDDLRLSVHKPNEQGVPFEIAAAARTGSGNFETQLLWTPPAELDSPAAGIGELQLETAQLPLQSLRPLLDRISLTEHVAADLTSDFDISWNTAGETAEYKLAGDLQTGALELVSVASESTEQLRADYLRCAVETTIAGPVVDVKKFDVDSDLAQVRLAGRTNLQELNFAEIGTSTLTQLAADDLQLQGRLDLAKLAAVLPETLHIREGTKITSGTINWNFTSREQQGRRGWSGDVSASKLTADHAGEVVSWDEPIRLNFSVVPNPSGAAAVRVKCESDFLTASLVGSPGKATVHCKCDLDRLAAEAGRFVDLGSIELHGTLGAIVDVSRTGDRFTADGQVNVNGLHVAGLQGITLNEPRLNLLCHTSADMQDGQLKKIDEASLQVTTTGYQLDMSLNGPAQWNDEKKSIPLTVNFDGELSGLAAQWKSLLPPDSPQIEGNAKIAAQLDLSPEKIGFRETRVDVEQLSLQSGEFRFNEPRVRIIAEGNYDLERAQLTSSATSLATTAVNVRAKNVDCNFGADSPRLSADVEFNGQLERMLTMADLSTLSEPLAGGTVTGRMLLTQNGGTSRAQGQIIVDQFVLYDRAPGAAPPGPGATLISSRSETPPLWHEPRLVVTSDMTYDPAADSVRIDGVQADGNQWKMLGQGRINELSTQMAMQAAGSIECDWEGLLAEHRTVIGDGIHLTGMRKHQFSVRGPLAAASGDTTGAFSLLDQLTGQLQLGWDAADIYGLHAGRAEVTANLGGGVVRVAKLNIPVSGGRLTAAPRVLLMQEPMLFVLPAGPVVENVQLSQEMCGTWLKYMTPMLADATLVDGRLSVAMNSAKVPIEDWQASQLSGELAIHSANVRPGPLAEQFLDVAEQVKAIINRKSSSSIINRDEAWMKINEQTVDFRMANGRVHHDSLEIRVRDVVIRTRGSVGLDETIALIAEVPVQDAWLKNDRYLSALKGQVVQIPITGTLTRPKVDRNVFEALARQIGTAAGTQLLEGEVQNQLQRLFRKK